MGWAGWVGGWGRSGGHAPAATAPSLHVAFVPPCFAPSGKPRGYAFIEYEHKDDMKQAYKMADGRKVEDRRVLVDVERGRTVPNW